MVKSGEIVQMNTPPHPYNQIISVKSLADIVGTEGDKSGFFEPPMTTMDWDMDGEAKKVSRCMETLLYRKWTD